MCVWSRYILREMIYARFYSTIQSDWCVRRFLNCKFWFDLDFSVVHFLRFLFLFLQCVCQIGLKMYCWTAALILNYTKFKNWINQILLLYDWFLISFRICVLHLYCGHRSNSHSSMIKIYFILKFCSLSQISTVYKHKRYQQLTYPFLRYKSIFRHKKKNDQVSN